MNLDRRQTLRRTSNGERNWLSWRISKSQNLICINRYSPRCHLTAIFGAEPESLHYEGDGS
jgi:hypothetical protein